MCRRKIHVDGRIESRSACCSVLPLSCVWSRSQVSDLIQDLVRRSFQTSASVEEGVLCRSVVRSRVSLDLADAGNCQTISSCCHARRTDQCEHHDRKHPSRGSRTVVEQLQRCDPVLLGTVRRVRSVLRLHAPASAVHDRT